MKKAVCLLFAAMFAVCGMGCGAKGTVNAYAHKTGAPDYTEASGELVLDSWIPPLPSDAAFKQYAECGYNMLHLGITSVEIGAQGVEKECRMMNDNFELAEKYGMKVILSMNALNSNQTIATPLKYLDTRIGTVLEEWKDTDTFYGYMPYDEPRFDQALEEGDLNKMQKGYDACVDYIRDEYLYFSEKYPGKTYEIVLLPPVVYDFAPNMGKSFDGDFNKYFTTFYDKVMKLMPYDERIISFDSYPFNQDRDGNIVNKGGFVRSLEELSYRAKSVNAAEKWTYIQNHNNVHNTAQVLYQYYTAMAYGYTHFVTYCYRDGWGEEIYSESAIGEKTENWYYFQKAHNEIKSFENVYLQFADDFAGALAVDGKERGAHDRSYGLNEKLLSSYDGIASITSSEDTLVGIMRDKKGYDGYMITNQALATGNTGNDVSIAFNGATHALVFANGKAGETVKLRDGKLDIRLKAGGGAFVIPYNEA